MKEEVKVSKEWSFGIDDPFDDPISAFMILAPVVLFVLSAITCAIAYLLTH